MKMLNPCIEDVFKIPELQIKYCQLCGSLFLSCDGCPFCKQRRKA